MKGVVLTVSILVAITAPLGAGTIYQEDFSFDPNWTTNNPDHYFWDMSSQTYYQKSVDGSDEYSYHALPGFQAGSRWRLQYDLLPAQLDYVGDSRLGFTDADLVSWHYAGISPQYFTVTVGHTDEGYKPSIHWITSEGVLEGDDWPGGVLTPGVWYSILVDYDPALSQFYTRISERDSGIVLVSDTSLVNGTFTSGLDRIAMSVIGDSGWSDGATGVSYIDNIRVEVIPAPGAIVLGGLGMGVVHWLRRRRVV
ncbi:MAG TPA: hypothetical protein VLI39_02630 [Sedimentisphaerales bacterium]|nr:hypothetical protein [Sedimentisphaerales bacterium]